MLSQTFHILSLPVDKSRKTVGHFSPHTGTDFLYTYALPYMRVQIISSHEMRGSLQERETGVSSAGEMEFREKEQKRERERMMEEKQEVFNPPQVLKLPPPSSLALVHSAANKSSWKLWGNTIFLFSGSRLYIKPALWHYYHEVPEDSNRKQRAVCAGSPCGCFEAAGGKQATCSGCESSHSNYEFAMVDQVFRSITEVSKGWLNHIKNIAAEKAPVSVLFSCVSV